MRPSCKLALACTLLATALFSDGALGQCGAPKSWFPHEQTPEPDNHAPASNCEFHQWAWQTFLWLTQPTGDGRIRLMDLPRDSELFMPGRGPETLGAATLERLHRRPLVLSPRATKREGATTFEGIRQAGSLGVLVDRKGRPVYYASHINPTYYQFVRSNRLFVKQNYIDAPATLNFPVGSLELKSSWRVVPEGESATGSFTTQALIHPLACAGSEAECQGKDIVVDLTRTERVTVALVGLHIVGVVEDHPEFIWSTFEHEGNAPDLPPGMSPTSDQPVSDRDFAFYAAGTPAKGCNLRNSEPAMPLVKLDVMANRLSPVTQVFRQFAFGGGDAEDRMNITGLNRSVHDQLAGDSVWKHYFLVGGVWFNRANGLEPGLAGPAIQQRVVGSVRLSNATMETFTQRSDRNCFACHDTAAEPARGLPAKNLNVSHILMNGLVQREELRLASARPQFAAERAAPPPLKSYAEVRALLDDFVAREMVPIDFAPHGAFWRTMSYRDFTEGNIPGVVDPSTGDPLRVLIPGSSRKSNLILSLLGAEGTIFDPINGSIGRMPPTGPFMPDADIARIADWIDRGAPEDP